MARTPSAGTSASMLRRLHCRHEVCLPAAGRRGTEAERPQSCQESPIKDECLDRVILFSGCMLHSSLAEFVAHYHSERPHQGLDNELLRPEPAILRNDGPVVGRERLGGLLRFYHRRRRRAG